jgi:hypothetical protein
MPFASKCASALAGSRCSPPHRRSAAVGVCLATGRVDGQVQLRPADLLAAPALLVMVMLAAAAYEPAEALDVELHDLTRRACLEHTEGPRRGRKQLAQSVGRHAGAARGTRCGDSCRAPARCGPGPSAAPSAGPGPRPRAHQRSVAVSAAVDTVDPSDPRPGVASGTRCCDSRRSRARHERRRVAQLREGVRHETAARCGRYGTSRSSGFRCGAEHPHPSRRALFVTYL